MHVRPCREHMTSACHCPAHLCCPSVGVAVATRLAACGIAPTVSQRSPTTASGRPGVLGAGDLARPPRLR
eukprot:13815924-Alexandrium_andersonii.AAC.1